MMKSRNIIEIDENQCNGCGLCILSCAEDAIKLVGGKAKLKSDVYCDGLGECIGACPEDALNIVEREAEDFDDIAVKNMKKKEKHHLGSNINTYLDSSCPGLSSVGIMFNEKGIEDQNVHLHNSELTNWPIKLQLINPMSAFLKNANLVLIADCVGISFPNLHRVILKDEAIAIGCPKLDNLDKHTKKIIDIIRESTINSLTVMYMEVPCCKGFVFAAKKAVETAKVKVPIFYVKIGIQGNILEKNIVEI